MPHAVGSGPGGPRRTPAHRVLAIIALLAAVAQGALGLLGDEVAAIAAVGMLGLATAFLGADLLAARDRPRGAMTLSAIAILVATASLAAIAPRGYVAMLAPPVAFIMALPYLRAGAALALGIGAIAVSGFAASAQPFRAVLDGTAAGDTIWTPVSALVAGLAASSAVCVLAWQVIRQREAIAERYETLVAGLPVGVSRTDPEGRLIEANEAYARMFGYPDPAAMVGIRSADRFMDPAEVSRVTARLRSGETVRDQLLARRRDGTAFWVRFTGQGALGDDGLPRWHDSVLEDVTAERRAQEDKERFAATMEAAELAIVNQSTSGVILGWNGAAQRLYGWGDEVRGQTVYDVSPEAEWDAVRERTARAAAGETIGPFEIERFYLDRWVHLSMTVVPVRDAAGAITGIATIGRDVTADVRLRAERARLEEQLREAQRLEATGRLAGGIAHDFNNLLTGIRLFGTELVGAFHSGSSVHVAAEHIVRSATQASELTHQLLAYARRQVLRPEVVSLDALIAEQLPTLRRTLGPTVDLVVDGSAVPALVSADREQLAEALVQLVLNARESMPDGGRVRLVTRVTPAAHGMDPAPGTGDEATAVAVPNEVVLRVEDTGRGIEEEALPHLFEPFYTTKEMGRGTGLGLAMVYGIVRQSGGRIDVATSPAGTTMTVRLPLAASLPAPVPAAVSASRPETVRILLVDDDAVVRTVARRILANAGHDVLEAADASQALTIADAEGEGIAILVTDVIMPGMHGPELARALRDDRPGLPVVFMSGYMGEDAGIDVTAARTAFVAKPFTAAGLLEAVASLAGTPGEPDATS